MLVTYFQRYFHSVQTNTAFSRISKLDVAGENVNLPLAAIPKQGTLPEKHLVTPESLGLQTVQKLQEMYQNNLEMDKDLKTRIFKLTVNVNEYSTTLESLNW